MCQHEKLKTVGDRLFCKICGQELPLEFLYGELKTKAPVAKAEEPVTEGKKQPDNQPVEEKPTKSPARKRAAKTGGKGGKKA